MPAEDALLQQIKNKSYNKLIYINPNNPTPYSETWSHPNPGAPIHMTITVIGAGLAGGLANGSFSGAGGNGGGIGIVVADITNDLNLYFSDISGPTPAETKVKDITATTTYIYALDGGGQSGQAHLAPTGIGALGGAGGKGYLGFGDGGKGGDYNGNSQAGQPGQSGAVILEWWI